MVGFLFLPIVFLVTLGYIVRTIRSRKMGRQGVVSHEKAGGGHATPPRQGRLSSALTLILHPERRHEPKIYWGESRADGGIHCCRDNTVHGQREDRSNTRSVHMRSSFWCLPCCDHWFPQVTWDESGNSGLRDPGRLSRQRSQASPFQAYNHGLVVAPPI
jgi:hypothetical protein